MLITPRNAAILGAMKKRIPLPGLAVAVLIVSPTTAQGATPMLAPSGKWAVEGEDGRCILSRSFGEGAGSITLAIEPQPLKPQVDLALKTVDRGAPFTRTASAVSFDDGDAPVATELESFDSTDGIPRVRRLSILRPALDRAARSGSITVTLEARSPARLSLAQFPAALAALDRCERAIVENVGLTPAQTAQIVHPAVPPRMLFHVYGGYAKDAEQGDLEDESVSRYIIDAKGKVTSCGVIHRALTPFLNNGACVYASTPLKFTPAKDAAGKPVIGLYFDRNRWSRR